MNTNKKIKIIRVPIPTPTLWPHTTTNSFLIGNEDECLLVDAGYDQKETRNELEKAIRDNDFAKPKAIVLTHSHQDHAPGVRQLTDWSATIYCHKDEDQATRNAISPIKELSYLNDGDTLHIADEEITIIHGPGHTAGQLNLYIPSEQVLIAGDNIVAEGTTWIGAPDGDMSAYIETLHRLKKLKLAKIGPGHGDWVLNPHEQIEFVLNRRLQREKQILSLLNEHKQLTATDLTNLIYQDSIHPSVFEVAKRTTEAHLMKLINEGLAKQQASEYTLQA